MKIYKITETVKNSIYVGWKVPLLVENSERIFEKTIVTEDELNDIAVETSANETDSFDGSDKRNWNRYMTDTKVSRTVTVDEYEEVLLERPSMFYAMVHLEEMKNPQSELDIATAPIMNDLYQKILPYVGKKIYIGTEGIFKYFLSPTLVGNSIILNPSLSLSTKDL